MTGEVRSALEARQRERKLRAGFRDDTRRAEERSEAILRAAEYEMDATRRTRAGKLTDEQWEAEATRRQAMEFRGYLRGHYPAGLEPAGAVETRDAGVGTGAAGGFLVPQDFSRRLAKAEAFFSAMTAASPPVDTAAGAPMPQAAIDDSGTSGAILTENVAATGPTDVTVATRTFNAFDYVSPLIRWSVQLAQDAGPWEDGSLEDQIAWLCGQRLGRIQNTHFTVGTGTAQPLGLFTSQAVAAGVVVGATSAAPTVVALADLVALYGSLDQAYMPDAKFMVSPATRTALRALVGTDGLPVFPAHLSLTIFGHDVIVNPAIPAVAATTFSAAFGDFGRGYTIRSVGEPSFHVLRERAMDQLAVEGFAVVRRDGAPSGDFRAIKLLQQHS